MNPITIFQGIPADSVIKSAQVRMRNQSAYEIPSTIITRADKDSQLGLDGSTPASAYGLKSYANRFDE